MLCGELLVESTDCGVDSNVGRIFADERVKIVVYKEVVGCAWNCRRVQIARGSVRVSDPAATTLEIADRHPIVRFFATGGYHSILGLQKYGGCSRSAEILVLTV